MMLFIHKVVFLVKFKHSLSASVHRTAVGHKILYNFVPSPSWGVVGIQIPAVWNVEEPQNLDIWGSPITFPRFLNLDTVWSVSIHRPFNARRKKSRFPFGTRPNGPRAQFEYYDDISTPFWSFS
jgi:hypothetical protein